MRGRLQVDLGALAKNFRAYSTFVQGSVGAVVKADAYGLGAERIARVLFSIGCNTFFVAIAEEGKWLRRVLPKAQILVFEGVAPGSIDDLIAADLIPVVNNFAQLAMWETGWSRPIAIHVDTGIGRLGFSPDVNRSDFDGYSIEMILTHLACADDPNHPQNKDQIERFKKITNEFPGIPTSIGNSEGILLGPEFIGNIGRPGIGLYGRVSSLDSLEITEVASLSGMVLQVERYGSGATLGYGSSYIAEKPIKVATVGIGYADGVPRSLSNCGVVSIAGRRCPIIGFVSMDLTLIDVTGLAVEPGDWAEFFGPQMALAEFADKASMLDYEILTGIGERVERIYVGDDQSVDSAAIG